MGYPRRPDVDPPVTDSRFVAHGLPYDCSFFAFFVFGVTLAATLGSRLLDHEIINFGGVGIAMMFFVVGNFLLLSFLFRHFASKPIRALSGQLSQSHDLWDEQLDG